MTQDRPFRANLLTACLVGVALLGLSACSTLAPAPLSQGDIDQVNQADRGTTRKDVQPVTGPLTLDEAMARALKYNLDRRVRLLEEAMALRQLDVTRLDMLPKLVAQAGYSDRSVERATFSSPFSPVYGPTSTDSSFSSAPNHSTLDLGLTWSLLDYGVGQYNARQQADRVLIAAEKRRKASLNYDSDKFLVDRNWQEAGLQLSFNFMNLLTGPAQKKLAEAGVALADQRRVATQMAVLTQVHLTRLQLLNARSQFKRSEEMYATDRRISELGRLRESAQAGSKLERVSNDTAAILSLLRRYQAMAQVQVAESRLLAQLGLEPQIGSTDELSLKDLTAQVKGEGNPWQRLVVSK